MSSTPSENHLLDLRVFKLLADVTRMAVSWSASFLRPVRFFASTIPDSARSSSQYAVSSSSCNALSVLLIISASERLRLPSRSCAPTDVPDRKTCLPITCASVVFGSAPYSRTIRSANSFVRSRMSHGRPSSFRIHHSSLFAKGYSGSMSTGISARPLMAVTMAGLTVPYFSTKARAPS